MSDFTGKTLLITGGTGSFGSTVLKHFLDSDLKEIRIFSRDEKKQDDMRHDLQAKHPAHGGEGEVLHRRRAQSAVGAGRDAGGGLHLPCGGAEAGAQL